MDFLVLVNGIKVTLKYISTILTNLFSSPSHITTDLKTTNTMEPLHESSPDLTAQSKALVLRFCEHLNRREFNDMRLLLDSTATWFVLGRPDKVPYAGTLPAEEQVNNVSAMLGQFDSFTFQVTGVTAEGQRVAVEAVTDGQGPDPSDRYRNIYIIQFVVAHGKIISVREFLDNFEVQHFMENKKSSKQTVSQILLSML